MHQVYGIVPNAGGYTKSFNDNSTNDNEMNPYRTFYVTCNNFHRSFKSDCSTAHKEVFHLFCRSIQIL